MPTYHEIMTTDLSALTTAADKWTGMAGEFGKQEKAYEKEVQGITLERTWIGQSADAANAQFRVMLNEYRAAQTQAKAIASLLRDAHTQFTEFKSKLQTVKADALKADMLISDSGRVTFDMSSLSEGSRTAYHHDPDYQKSVRDAVGSWQRAVDRLVAQTSDADAGVEIALKAVVKDTDATDGTRDGFNAKALGDIETYELRNTEEIAERLLDGKKVSDADLAEMDRAMRDQAGDKVFAQSLLNKLGPEGLVGLSDVMSDRERDGGSFAGQYTKLLGGLANTVATATQVPGSMADAGPGSAKYQAWLNSPDGAFYKNFTEGLKEAGAKNYDSKTNPLYGYRPFVEMMTRADQPFDDQFLNQLGHDMIAAEKDNRAIFEQWGGNHREGRADALDSLLGVMSKNPDAATAFFDPKMEHGQAHLDYLVGNGDDAREWPKLNTVAGPRLIIEDDPLSRHGLGLALEVGATGNEPGAPLGKPGPHSEGQARVMQGIIAALDQGTKGDTVPEALKVPLGRVLNDYTADTHAILGGYAPGSPSGLDDVEGSGESASITNGKASLLRVMRGVSDGVAGEDADGNPIRVFDALYEAQRQYAVEYLDTGDRVPQSSLTENVTGWDVRSRDVGQAFGGMNAIATDMILDVRDAEIGKINDQARYGYHGLGAVANMIPQAGDIAQRAVDAAMYEWSVGVAEEAELVAKGQVSEKTAWGITSTNGLIQDWADTRGASKESNAVRNAVQEAGQSYITGREEAYSALRTRK
ncbi:hypothetical protein J7F02_25840 [Streptomyces sp. ISL-112]|uniref:hypothetical protein n=1 Tax=unclassified Streptomyces TaxID=2593676 RepID=UPI001BEAD803|nr:MULTISPECIES: hypothetical protein [unclassified Streptomyces]MBT2428956.1 hypothetical protein [Streptomyces sp. ISL-112]MBT2464146.1 hypothetical protein [Streptomyces sp. ISL-63]